jgi:hypothetical protein
MSVIPCPKCGCPTIEDAELGGAWCPACARLPARLSTEDVPHGRRDRACPPLIAHSRDYSVTTLALAWGSVRAGLDLVAVGLAFLAICSAAGLACTPGTPLSPTAGKLIPMLILAGAVIGFVLVDAGMCLAWTAPPSEPAQRIGRWLPACIALKALIVLAILCAGAINGRMTAVPFRWMFGTEVFAVLRVCLLVAVGLQTLAFFLFLRSLAHSLRNKRLARITTLFLASSLGVCALGCLFGLMLELHSAPPGDRPGEFLSVYLIPLLDPIDREFFAFLIDPGSPSTQSRVRAVYIVFVLATCLAAGSVILVIWARQALTRALLPAGESS